MTIVTTGPPPLNPGDLAEIKIGHASSLPVSLLFVGRALRTLWSNRKARIGLVILAVVILVALFALSPTSTPAEPAEPDLLVGFGERDIKVLVAVLAAGTCMFAVGQIATASLMIVTRPDFPANNVKELVAYAKEHPGKVVFASPGFGATQHFAGEMFKQIAGVDLLHVPYKTSPEAINAVLGKHADILFDTVSALIGQVKSGQLKALAVTGKDRFPAVPDVPPAADSGVLPGFDVTTWYGLFAPRGTPPAVIAKLNKTLNESLADDAVKTRMATVGVVVKSSTPDEYGKFLASEYKRWNAVREAAGIPQQ